MTFIHPAAALPPCLINSHPGSRDGFFFFPENPRRKGSVPGTPPSYGLGNYGGQRAADHTTNEADALHAWIQHGHAHFRTVSTCLLPTHFRHAAQAMFISQGHSSWPLLQKSLSLSIFICRLKSQNQVSTSTFSFIILLPVQPPENTMGKNVCFSLYMTKTTFPLKMLFFSSHWN